MTDIAWLRSVEAYLIDLDGTMYRGQEGIPDAPDFIRWLERTGKKYLFVTNNSTRRPEQVAEHLRHFGIRAEVEHVLTTSQVAGQYIVAENRPSKRVFMLGEEGLRYALEEEAGCTLLSEEEAMRGGVDYVVQGMDRQFNYQKLKAASFAIQKGATYIATNIDKMLPTEEGFLPGSGSLLAALQTASGVEPIVMGKPNARMIEYAVQRLGVAKERAVVLGDNLETDILAGQQAGVRTLLVLSGYSKREDIAGSPGQPTAVVESLTELMQLAGTA